MIHFDDVLSTAKEVVASDPTYSDIEEVLVLRDLRGRVRLFLKPNENKKNEVGALCDRLSTSNYGASKRGWTISLIINSRATAW